MYTYEELLRLSGFNERKGEKERFYKKWKELSDTLLEDGEKEKMETHLRDDEIMPALKNSEAIKNAKSSKDGFIQVSEAYYEG